MSIGYKNIYDLIYDHDTMMQIAMIDEWPLTMCHVTSE